jgi:serine/threonine protein kinase
MESVSQQPLDHIEHGKWLAGFAIPSDEAPRFAEFENHPLSESDRQKLADCLPKISRESDMTILHEGTRNQETEIQEHILYFFLDKTTDILFHGSVDRAKGSIISLEEAKQCLRPVPDNEIYPTIPSEFPVILHADIDGSTFVKRPILLLDIALGDSGKRAERFLYEARNSLLVHQKPHKNLLEVKGFLERRGRLVGIALEKYPTTLERRRNETLVELDGKACCEGIEAALNHLHDLGYAHNDVKPDNVLMKDKGSEVFLADFGAMGKIGEELIYEFGTNDWNEGFDSFSSTKNDLIGLRKIKETLNCS